MVRVEGWRKEMEDILEYRVPSPGNGSFKEHSGQRILKRGEQGFSTVLLSTR